MKKDKPEAALIIALSEKDKDKEEESDNPEVEMMRQFEDAKSASEKASILKDFIALCLLRKEEAEEEGEEY